MLSLLTVAWVFVGIQSPFLVLCSYGLMRRFSWIASPYLVIPAVSAVCGTFYLFFGIISPGTALYSHFLFAGGLILWTYAILTFAFGYARVESLVLSLLTMMALDELWQTPFNVINWTASLRGFEFGIVTAGWNLMSLPLIFYFLLKFGRRITLGKWEKGTLGLCIGLTAFEIWRFYIGGYPSNPSPIPLPTLEPYYLVLPWVAFFLAVFRASRDTAGRPHNAHGGSGPV